MFGTIRGNRGVFCLGLGTVRRGGGTTLVLAIVLVCAHRIGTSCREGKGEERGKRYNHIDNARPNSGPLVGTITVNRRAE